MKLADDALVAIVLSFQRGLCEGIDISDLLRSMELVERPDGKLGLAPQSESMKTPPDIWEED